jgi:hypothetical protein
MQCAILCVLSAKPHPTALSHLGRDALPRVLNDPLSEGIQCNEPYYASFQRSHIQRRFPIWVGTRCRAFPEIPL